MSGAGPMTHRQVHMIPLKGRGAYASQDFRTDHACCTLNPFLLPETDLYHIYPPDFYLGTYTVLITVVSDQWV